MAICSETMTSFSSSMLWLWAELGDIKRFYVINSEWGDGDYLSPRCWSWESKVETISAPHAIPWCVFLSSHVNIATPWSSQSNRRITSASEKNRLNKKSIKYEMSIRADSWIARIKKHIIVIHPGNRSDKKANMFQCLHYFSRWVGHWIRPHLFKQVNGKKLSRSSVRLNQ